MGYNRNDEEDFIDKFGRVISYIIDHWKAIIFYVGSILAVIGIISFMNNCTNIMSETKEQEKVVATWYDQLPDNHWIKQNEEFNFDYEIMSLINSLKGYAFGAFNLSFEAMSQEDGEIGEILSYALSREVEKDKNEYVLLTNDNKKIGKFSKIKVKQGDDIQLSFLYDNTQMKFDFSKEEYTNDYKNIMNSFVYSYIENPDIATIYNGKIIGVKKGKTKLCISCGKYLFKYIIQVKSGDTI